jgi:hypothetical protein
MIDKNSGEPQTSSSSAKAGASVPLLDPRGKIEVSSGGNGTVNDPSGSDIKPPFTSGFEIPI